MTQTTGTTTNRQCANCPTPLDDGTLTAVYGIELCQQCADNPDLAGIARRKLAQTYHPDDYKVVIDMIAELQSERDVLEGMQYINDFIFARYQKQIETIERMAAEIEQLKSDEAKRQKRYAIFGASLRSGIALLDRTNHRQYD